MFEEKAKLTRTRTVKNCLGKKKYIQKEAIPINAFSLDIDLVE